MATCRRTACYSLQPDRWRLLLLFLLLLHCLQVFDYLGMTRVYTKPKGQMPDYSAPVILRGTTEPSVENFCDKIHRTLKTDFKYAWVWGASVKHNPGRVGKAHVLQDEDVIQIVKKI